MAKEFHRNGFTWIAYFLLALYAYFLNILGPITPFLHDELQISYTVISLHFTAFAIGILVVGAAGHFIIRRTGRLMALSIGALGLGLGALLLVIGRTPPVTIGASFIMGCVGSLILAVVPTALSDEHGEMAGVAITEANVLSSLISTAAPLLVGWLVSILVGRRLALIIAALAAIGIGVSLFRPSRSREKGAAPAQVKAPLPFLFWVYWFTLVMAVAVEFCMIYWSADYLESELGMQRASAAQAVSLFLAGMIAGRLVSSWLLRYISAPRLVLASILLGMVGFGLYWGASSPLVGLIGLALSGLGVASLYPLILSIAIRSANGSTVQAGARATLASGVAILLLPLALGWLADIVGLRAAYTVVAVLFAGMLLMMLAASRVRLRQAAGHLSS